MYGKGKWDNPIGDNYGVSATPTYFVLNKDKKIVSKPYDFKALKEYMDKNIIKIEKPKEDKKDSETKDESNKED